MSHHLTEMLLTCSRLLDQYDIDYVATGKTALSILQNKIPPSLSNVVLVAYPEHPNRLGVFMRTLRNKGYSITTFSDSWDIRKVEAGLSIYSPSVRLNLCKRDGTTWISSDSTGHCHDFMNPEYHFFQGSFLKIAKGTGSYFLSHRFKRFCADRIYWHTGRMSKYAYLTLLELFKSLLVAFEKDNILDPSVKRGFLHEPFGPKGITKKPRRTQRVRLRFFATFCLQSIRTEIPRLTDGSRNITYWIDYGTLLGAIRYQGIIPSDENMNISVLAEDRDKVFALSSFLQEYGYAMRYRCQSKENRDCISVFSSRRGRLSINMAIRIRRNSLLVDPLSGSSENKGSLRKLSVALALRDVFPLKLYPFYNVKVCGPRHAHRILKQYYGETYLTHTLPWRACHARYIGQNILKRGGQIGQPIHEFCPAQAPRYYAGTEGLDHAYIISAKDDAKRRHHVQHMVKNRLPQAKIFLAVNGLTLTESNLQRYIAQRYMTKDFDYSSFSWKRLTTGQVGCALSHMCLWEQLIDRRTPYMLVLEDDAFLTNDFMTKYTTLLDHLPVDFDYISLFHHPEQLDLLKQKKGIARRNNYFIKPPPNLWGTMGYIISYYGACKILSHVKPLYTTIDRMISDLAHRRLIYAFEKRY
ncbi:MAG: hypothetical protein GKR87_02445 [Kiritimatiellae bacterium]|nr:hypothetical protein [Kiritimatiellia bacterium]